MSGYTAPFTDQSQSGVQLGADIIDTRLIRLPFNSLKQFLPKISFREIIDEGLGVFLYNQR
ncbi:MAG: hypothetical protein AAF583_00695 [Pseudomonadota bacterium]